MPVNGEIDCARCGERKDEAYSIIWSAKRKVFEAICDGCLDAISLDLKK